ncbi:hypothetical protein HNY73_011167 [Argiope bruennichi]|uniref:Uncharacterized protein n=1 Tax=Argiope bruennichi TaxID=94029 RepID=A0A8T0F5G4_ARGBR|nr:hypothetical protein HNY73_011167 [Argiope bruennichi]
MWESKICYELIREKPYKTPCGCSFHEECWNEEIEQEDTKRCYQYNAYIAKQLDFPVHDLFTQLDDMQCIYCNWKLVKKISFTLDSIRLRFVFNHHCNFCYINCSYMIKSSNIPLTIKEILSDLKPYDGSFSNRGKRIYGDSAKPYNKYEYLYCKRCNNQVMFENEDIESMNPDDPILPKPCNYSSSFRCNNLTYGTLLDCTY